MGRRGKKRQLEVEARYWQLLESGVGTVEACRRVGITRKTGYRWRVEAGGVVPDRLADAVRSNRYLSLTERLRIDRLHRDRVSVREIGRRLGRSPSTISRELRRNTARHDRGYDATLAMLGREPVALGRVGRGWRPTPSCAPWCRTSLSWSGVPNRSPPICARRSPIGRGGMSVTRRFIRRSIAALGAV